MCGFSNTVCRILDAYGMLISLLLVEFLAMRACVTRVLLEVQCNQRLLEFVEATRCLLNYCLHYWLYTIVHDMYCPNSVKTTPSPFAVT